MPDTDSEQEKNYCIEGCLCRNSRQINSDVIVDGAARTGQGSTTQHMLCSMHSMCKQTIRDRPKTAATADQSVLLADSDRYQRTLETTGGQTTLKKSNFRHISISVKA